MTMNVEEARDASVCRICGEPIKCAGPEGWQTEFGRMVFPVAITLNFGDEFAHTACLAMPESPTPSPERSET